MTAGTDGSAPFPPPGTTAGETAPTPAAEPEPGRPHVLVVKNAYAAPLAPDPDDLPTGFGDRVRGMLSGDDKKKKEPFYPRVLRLRHVKPNGWQRALLVEGMLILGTLVALADLATAWSPVILVLATAVVVKFNDVLAGLLPDRRHTTSDAPPQGPPGGL